MEPASRPAPGLPRSIRAPSRSRIRGALMRGFTCAAPALLAAGLLLLTTAPAAAAGLDVLLADPAFAPFDDPSRTVVLRGIGFTPSTTVAFGGTAAAVVFVDSRTLQVTVPVMASPRITTVTVQDPSHGTGTFYPFLHTGPVYYVSTTGDDLNSGADPASPMRTIDAALYLADAVTPTEIRAAGGLYLEAGVRIWHASVLSCGWSQDFTARDTDVHVTEINAGRMGYVVRTAGINNASVIDGCTIARGFRDSFGGGGVVVSADSAVVNNNVIVGNATSTIGGGIYWVASTSYGGKPTFSNNVILGNRAFNREGGGIVIYPHYNTLQEIRVNITRNRILGNRSFGGAGGGVSLSTSSYAGYNQGALKMTDNLVGYNRARASAGIDVSLLTYGDYFDLLVENHLVVGNRALGPGGGLALRGMGRVDGVISSSTVADNLAAPGMVGGMIIGGALSLLDGFAAHDLILWGNQGGDIQTSASGRVTHTISGTPIAGTGNLSVDPAFTAGEQGDYYLAQGDPNLPVSPAIDAGSAGASALSLECLTTCPSHAADAGTADIGYHYPPLAGTSPGTLALQRIDPPSGDFQGNDWVLLRGEGFDPAATAEFDGTPAAESIYVSERRLLVEPPPHPLGFVNVRVWNPGGAHADLISGYRYEDTEPPVWRTTVGIVSAHWPEDCMRTVVVEWNEAVDGVSPPVLYEIHREECLPSYETGVPCDNFGFTPNSANLVGRTVERSFLDTVFPNQDLPYVYAVRARDSADPFNKEWNHGKHVVPLVGYDNSDSTPPEEVGETLTWIDGQAGLMDWAAPRGVLEYGLYREASASAFGSPSSMTPHAVLGPSNHDGNGDGVADSHYTDAAVPSPGGVLYYRVTAIDPCGNETLGELLGP